VLQNVSKKRNNHLRGIASFWGERGKEVIIHFRLKFNFINL